MQSGDFQIELWNTNRQSCYLNELFHVNMNDLLVSVTQNY